LCDQSISLALAGGEDYELLFTAPASRKQEISAILQRLGTPVTAIGEITDGRRLHVISGDGSEYRITKRGFNHFA
jgi:thiamine-monophosphate kinase